MMQKAPLSAPITWKRDQMEISTPLSAIEKSSFQYNLTNRKCSQCFSTNPYGHWVRDHQKYDGFHVLCQHCYSKLSLKPTDIYPKLIQFCENCATNPIENCPTCIKLQEVQGFIVLKRYIVQQLP